jgi:hypothetical protein
MAVQKGQASEPMSWMKNQVSEMITKSDSDECQCNVAATEEEYCEEVLMEPHLRLQC